MKKHDAKGQEQNGENIGININTDENIEGTQNLNEPLTDESEVDKLKQQVQELNDKYIRQAAEFDNFRRRSAKERMELIQTAGKEVITELLDVLDDSDRAQKQMEGTEDVQQIKEGVQLVFTKLRSPAPGVQCRSARSHHRNRCR
jgi:molecular chaperone GrpE